MKILLIDYLSPSGHIIFDEIHIQSLMELGYELQLVGRKGQFPRVVENEQVHKTDLPEKYYQKQRFIQLTSRIKGIQCLFWIKKHININNYDKVVFLSYDILSLFFFRIEGQVLLVNHNNVDQLDSKVKLNMTKQLPKNYEHIALNEFMKAEMFKLLPHAIIHTVPHGVLKLSNSQIKPTFVIEGENFIFCPVNRNYNLEVVDEIIHSEMFNKFLFENNIRLYVKKQLLSRSKGNIKVIGRLTDEEYNYMLSKAIAVLLPYGDEFKYRCSGIFFECVAADTPMIATDRPNLLIFKDKTNIRFFRDIQSLKDCIKLTLNNSKKTYNKNLFEPKDNWRSILG